MPNPAGAVFVLQSVLQCLHRGGDAAAAVDHDRGAVLADGHDDGRNVKTGADELPFIVEQGGIAFLFPIERAYAFSP